MAIRHSAVIGRYNLSSPVFPLKLFKTAIFKGNLLYKVCAVLIHLFYDLFTLLFKVFPVFELKQVKTGFFYCKPVITGLFGFNSLILSFVQFDNSSISSFFHSNRFKPGFFIVNLL